MILRLGPALSCMLHMLPAAASTLSLSRCVLQQLPASQAQPNLLLGLLLLVLPAIATRLDDMYQAVAWCSLPAPADWPAESCDAYAAFSFYAEVRTLMQLLGQADLTRYNHSYRTHHGQLPRITHASTLNSGSVRMRSQAPSPCFLTPERSAFSSAGSQTLYSLQITVKWPTCVCTDACVHTWFAVSQVACTHYCTCCQQGCERRLKQPLRTFGSQNMQIQRCCCTGWHWGFSCAHLTWRFPCP